MKPLPSLAPFASLLAEVGLELRRGSCCMINADKGWTQLFAADLRERVTSFEWNWTYIDGRPAANDSRPEDVGIMLIALGQLRRAVRNSPENTVIALPHLDVMAASDGGWTNISRELVPLLYEQPEAILLGFCDPTVTVLPVVEKLFPKKFTLAEPYGVVDTSHSATATCEEKLS